MRNPLLPQTIERISAAQTPAVPTLEKQVEVLSDLIERRVGTGEMIMRWQIKRAELEWQIVCRDEGINATEAQVDALLAILERPEYDATPEQEQQAAESARIDEWLSSGEQADASYGTLDIEGHSWRDERNSRPAPY